MIVRLVAVTSRHLLKLDCMLPVNPPLKELLEFYTYEEILDQLFLVRQAVISEMFDDKEALHDAFLMLHFFDLAAFHQSQSPENEESISD